MARFMWVFVVLLALQGRPSGAITTVHHDKPESVTISTLATTTTTASRPLVANVTLTPSERKKRLLPYENFYLEQPFNLPQRQGGYYAKTNPKYQFESTRLKTKGEDGQKFTPFLESNALPGPFRPMVKNTSPPISFDYVSLNAPVEEDEYSVNREPPNLSAIYDTLSQLKLRQQELRKPPFGYRLVPPQRYQNYANIKQYQQAPDNRYKIQPSKTTIETFTATNIDITAPGDGFVPSRYVPVKNNHKEYTKPFVHQQFVIEVPKSSYPLPEYQTVLRKPQPPPKSNQNVPRKPGRKPLVLVRKPKPVTVVEENYVANKYVPILPLKFNPPIYVPIEPQYQPNYDDLRYEPQRPVTPQYVQGYTPRPQPVVTTVAPATTPLPEYPQVYHVTPKPVSFQQDSNTLADLLKQLQETNTLPQTLTPDNIDNSIKTLVKILEALRTRQKQHKPIVVHDEYEEDIDNEAGVDLGGPDGDAFDTPDGGTPGKPGVDYPALSTIPPTSFSCKTQRYKGFFGDPDTNCQVWHYCDLNGGQASFLCPNGTIFSQVALTCDWWYNVKCASTAQLYVLNERLYKYIIPLAPKFPEDYSGPLVDKYLALKFQEMEEKLRKQKKGKVDSGSEEKDDNGEETETTKPDEEENSEETSSEEEKTER